MPTPRFFVKSLLPAACTLACAGLFTACAVGPDYRRPAVAAPAAYKQDPAAGQKQPALAADWWRLFNDPVLTSLVDQTLAANLDIQAAMARVDQARAATRSARGDFSPAVSVDPSVRRSRSSANSGSGNGRTSTTYALPFDLTYEIDLWGRLRRQYEYYQNTEQASVAEQAFVLQTAVADVAQAYFNIRYYDRQVAILEKARDLYGRQLELTETKYRAGLALQTDRLQARTQINTATNQLIDVQRARAKQEHAIAILLGRPPAEFSLAVAETTTALPVIPAGLPASLLNQRPDVIQAERRLAAANAQVGVAQADFYPTFSLTGSAGYESADLSQLTNWKNRVWSLGPSLSLPLFQGGKLRAALEQSQAAYRELVAAYRSAVLTAYQDVEDQLSDLGYLAQKADSLEETLVSAREYFRLTEVQNKQGLSTYLQVIDANQTLLTNELSAAETQNQRLAATVLLIKALGGGWDPTPATTAQTGSK